jgi:SAM-dependent methyltransferase
MTKDAPVPIAPVDERVYEVLARDGFGPDLFNPRQHRACELVDAYALHHAIDLCGRLGVAEIVRVPRTVGEVMAAAGFVAGFRPFVAWLLAHLAQAGVLDREEEQYVLRGALPVALLAEIREAGLPTDPEYEPAYALLDAAAAACPQIATGATTGERALLSKLRLWAAYFSNDNPYYAIANRVAAKAAADRLADGATVLEVGAGLGSAAAALLEELAKRGVRLAAYHATEPVPFFQRRAQSMLAEAHPDVAITFGSLDLNRGWAEQGVAPGSRQMVWGVNVFHLARDLDAVLREAREALAPGGWLVVGEGVRPFPEVTVGAEMPFRLLGSFNDVRLDAKRRPTAGFLTGEAWLGVLASAGFDEVAPVPHVVAVREIYSGFVAVAACARRA